MIDASFNTTLVLILLVIASIIVYILCKYLLIPFTQFVFDFLILILQKNGMTTSTNRPWPMPSWIASPLMRFGLN